jgi:protease PrsW
VIPTELLLPALVALAPVACFLGALIVLDSYKLVKLRTVLGVVAGGALAAGAGYLLNAWALAATGLGAAQYSRYLAPLLEEALKATIIVALIRTHRIGFLVDAAILGFGVGSGFALVENLVYLAQSPAAGLGTWIVRGFGTAVMHGGATALFAVIVLASVEQAAALRVSALLLGIAPAIVVHAAFNHLLAWPRLATLMALVAVPLLVDEAFRRSDKALGDWLGRGFDADAEMLELINSGQFSASHVGQYLHTLKDRFRGPIVADLLCYLRLSTELSLRAKGILMMRENGFDAPVDEATRAKFTELRYLERSIGRTGLLALRPLCHMSHKELWQLYMLED